MMSGDGLSLPSTFQGFAQEADSNHNPNPNANNQLKRKRNLPGTPDPDAEVIAMSPKSLMATNRFICEICHKGFQRDQNLQLHRRGHNLPWKLKQRSKQEVVRKKVYVCPEKTCVHHEPSRALGDLTGIKKHFSRKHGEKKWKCDKCSKKYAVQSDWKAHSKVCGTREYRCDCGTLFSRKDSFVTHRAFCDALAAEQSARFNLGSNTNMINPSFLNGANAQRIPNFMPLFQPEFSGSDLGNSTCHLNSNIGFMPDQPTDMFGSSSTSQMQWLVNKFPEDGSFTDTSLPRGVVLLKEEDESKGSLSDHYRRHHHHHQQQQQQQPQPQLPMSATALLQTAAQMGTTRNNNDDTALGFMRSSAPNNLNDLVNSMSCSAQQATTMGGGPSSSLVLSDKHLMMMMMPVGGGGGGNVMKQVMKQSREREQSGLTRDFLGVGGGDHDGIKGVPFFEQELAKLASMDGDFSHYTSTSGPQ